MIGKGDFFLPLFAITSNTRNKALQYLLDEVKKYAKRQPAICELHVCNMRMASLHFAFFFHV